MMNPQDLLNKAQKVRQAHAQQSTQASALSRFGIEPTVAALFFLVDWLLFSGELFTGMISLPLSITIGIILGLWAMKKQRHRGDSQQLSLFKGLSLAVLTAIPTPVGGTLIAALGILQLFLDKKEDPSTHPPLSSEEEDTNNNARMRNVTPTAKSSQENKQEKNNDDKDGDLS